MRIRTVAEKNAKKFISQFSPVIFLWNFDSLFQESFEIYGPGLRLQLLYVNQGGIAEIVMMKGLPWQRFEKFVSPNVTWSTGVSPACNAQQTVWGLQSKLFDLLLDRDSLARRYHLLYWSTAFLIKELICCWTSAHTIRKKSVYQSFSLLRD